MWSAGGEFEFDTPPHPTPNCPPLQPLVTPHNFMISKKKKSYWERGLRRAAHFTTVLHRKASQDNKTHQTLSRINTSITGDNVTLMFKQNDSAVFTFSYRRSIGTADPPTVPQSDWINRQRKKIKIIRALNIKSSHNCWKRSLLMPTLINSKGTKGLFSI